MSNKLMDLPNEGVVTRDYLTKVKIVTNIPNQFTKAHYTDAGYDLVAASYGEVLPKHREVICTGLRVAIPKGYVGIIKPRSGLAAKHGIHTLAGVIDSGYRGLVKVLLYNTDNSTFKYSTGSKIAQMVIVPICQFDTLNVDSLEDTDRGVGGFNSTGY